MSLVDERIHNVNVGKIIARVNIEEEGENEVSSDFNNTPLQVAMTYSVELFICMIIGLVMGHAIFNTGDYSYFLYQVFYSISTLTGAAVGGSVDPCCASQAVTPDPRPDEAAIM